ncbi:MAG TPA: diacylglycerol kinase family protein [Conexibacter sp.]|nr:diacylglycerol kinase family protein [Conexibacter sp.]
MSRQRAAAIGALALAAGGLALAVVVAAEAFPRGLIALVLVAFGAAAAWYALLHVGAVRIAALAVGALLLAAAIVLVAKDRLLAEALVVGAFVLSTALGRAAFAQRVRLPPQPPPRRAVLFYNPKSGGGKAERFRLADEARARGIEPVELRLDDDLTRLVRDAVAGGADGLAMAGGDGSQAIVAAIAAEHDLPYACVPAGTRNHFALDLGVDRDDVVGALDAFVDGGERRVDLAEVNGRVFVNNVSLGLYAEAVQRPGYREAKLRTLAETLPEALAPGEAAPGLRWIGPDGREQRTGAAVLVSNNRYRLGRALGSGTRPRLDAGLLGIAVAGGGLGHSGRRLPWQEWATRAFDVDADEPVAAVPAGIDGEAVALAPPLRFRTRPGALRVRVARAHPGASPAAALPDSVAATIRALARIAFA